MRANRALLAVHFLLAACWLPAFAQIGGDKKKDDTKKEAEKITAETKVAGKVWARIALTRLEVPLFL